MMKEKNFTFYMPSSKKEMQSRFVEIETHKELPLFLLPKIVLFPGNSLPLTSLEGLKASELQIAQKGLLRIGVLTRLNPAGDPKAEISFFGTEASVTGLMKLSNGGFGAVVRGLRRFYVNQLTKKKNVYYGKVTILEEKPWKNTESFLASVKALKALIFKLLKLNPAISQENMASLYSHEDPGLLCDLVAPYLSITSQEKLALLGGYSLKERVILTLKFLSRELDLLQISTRIQEEVRDEMQDSLRKSFLKEQMTAIKRELGEMEGEMDEVEEMEASLAKLPLPKNIQIIMERELERISMMNPSSPEYMVAWNYLNWAKDLPWRPEKGKNEKGRKVERETPPISLSQAENVLERNHYGLGKIKERILEYLAVLQHRGTVKGQILLFVGPPGVGKTSLARSIAEALKRPFTRISLGGVKDEAEIRGHRRTYIGSMPGKIMLGIKETQSYRPVVLLDEIDKVGVDSINNLSSALLEVLDPEQNKSFTDHYLAYPFDLSQVIFIATANNLRDISHPLLDRMEVIELSGYTEQEKVQIANRYIVPSVRQEFGLTATQLKPNDAILQLIIRHYTRESGVRQLKREINSIGRKMVKSLVRDKTKVAKLTDSTITEFLGKPHFYDEPKDFFLEPGVAIGLAYTAVGGDILYCEGRYSIGKDSGGRKLLLTGSLGKVMQESAQAVLSYLLSRAKELNLDVNLIEKSHIHLHLPDGATPKDGPSAGLALMCTLMSLFTNKALPSDLAMTGEITLRGQVLPVGGIKEKLLAAHRYHKTKVILPAANWLDLDDIPQEILESLEIFPVKTMEEALQVAGLLPDVIPDSKIAPVKFLKRKFKRVPLQNWQPENAPWMN